MPSRRFGRILAIHPRRELSRDPWILVEEFSNAGFNKIEALICRIMVKKYPDVMSGLLIGEITPEEAARTASENTRIGYECGKLLFEELGVNKHEAADADLSIFEDGDGLAFEFFDGEAMLVRCESSKTCVKIPRTVRGCAVTAIGKRAFKNCGAFSIEVPGTVRGIGEGAFSLCDALSELSIPGPVLRIEPMMCYGCSSLESISLPDTVRSIGIEAFEGCRSLHSLTIPKSVVVIGEAAFIGCGSLSSVKIEGPVTTIGPWAFSMCGSLESVEIPSTLGCLQEGVFSHCVRLNGFELPDSLETIGDSAFQGCPKKTMKIPDSVTWIGDKAFYGSRIESLEMSASIEHIGREAFDRCTGLCHVEGIST